MTDSKQAATNSTTMASLLVSLPRLLMMFMITLSLVETWVFCRNFFGSRGRHLHSNQKYRSHRYLLCEFDRALSAFDGPACCPSASPKDAYLYLGA
jgi:hypothetical protein